MHDDSGYNDANGDLRLFGEDGPRMVWTLQISITPATLFTFSLSNRLLIKHVLSHTMRHSCLNHFRVASVTKCLLSFALHNLSLAAERTLKIPFIFILRAYRFEHCESCELYSDQFAAPCDEYIPIELPTSTLARNQDTPKTRYFVFSFGQNSQQAFISLPERGHSSVVHRQI